jgi:hypothetical protein
MDFAGTLSTGTMHAAVAIMRAKGIPTPQDLQPLVDAMRAEVIAGYDDAIASARAILDASMGEALLKADLNASCNLFAARALRATGLLPAEAGT